LVAFGNGFSVSTEAIDMRQIKIAFLLSSSVVAHPFMQAMSKSRKESQSQFSKKWRISEISVRDLRSDVSG
jgi:hypothetical protein